MELSQLVVWSHGLDKLAEFHSHLNNLRKSIKFTMEKEQTNFLPFLDVLVMKLVMKEENQITTTIHNKGTHRPSHTITISRIIIQKLRMASLHLDKS